MKKKTIAVLFGGRSAEYEVSLQSVRAVLSNIDTERFDIVPIGITSGGDWYHYTGSYRDISNNTWFKKSEENFPVALSPSRCAKGFLEFKEGQAALIPVDLAFPVLHGKNGEDGTLQGMLELAGIPVVGCGALSSALCMDKDRAHKLVSLAGISGAKIGHLQPLSARNRLERNCRMLNLSTFCEAGPLRVVLWNHKSDGTAKAQRSGRAGVCV